MQWSASPSGTVWRKRVHLVGPAESGQVTSIVRYDANAGFPAHDHPDGEEIFVIDGVFSDEHGDWPAGTYLLNPEGFRHAPFSGKGCVLFVKLRQYPGRNRQQVALDTAALKWREGAKLGTWYKKLYAQDGYTDTMELQKWEGRPGVMSYPDGAEIFVLEGRFSDEHGDYRQGHWLRFPAGARHHPTTSTGCSVYLKRGGLAYLKSVPVTAT